MILLLLPMLPELLHLLGKLGSTHMIMIWLEIPVSMSSTKLLFGHKLCFTVMNGWVSRRDEHVVVDTCGSEFEVSYSYLCALIECTHSFKGSKYSTFFTDLLRVVLC